MMQAPIIKYRLPSDPSVWVELIDDEDVSLMFDEFKDVVAASQSNIAPSVPTSTTSDSSSAGSAASWNNSRIAQAQHIKLHIFVQWRSDTDAKEGYGVDNDVANAFVVNGDVANALLVNGGVANALIVNVDGDGKKQSSGGGACTAADGGGDVQSSSSRVEGAPAPFNEPSVQGEAKDEDTIPTHPPSEGRDAKPTSHRRQRRHARVDPRRSGSGVDVAGLLDRMEVINAADISLIKFLGAGGYGDVYLGKWHSCEVAVKCLNPSLFFQGGGGAADPGGSINRAAVIDLIREADMLGSLRHPAIVWMYHSN